MAGQKGWQWLDTKDAQMSDRPIVFGAAYSVYVRAVRLVLHEKGVAYDLVPIDVFASSGVPPEHLARHPFGRIPAFEHDGFTLYESGAIARYIDAAFDGPPLQPAEPRAQARMNQALSVLDGYCYRTLVWDIFVERVRAPATGRAPDEARIAAALPRADTCLRALAEIGGAGPWLARQPWMQPLEIQPQPDQLFIWALARLPFQTFAAEPVPDAKAALAQLHQRLSTDISWREHLIGPFPLVMTNNEISLHGLPFITPNVEAVSEPAGDFLVGGFFPNPGRSKPLPPELFAPLSRSNLVYYHWEITPERLNELPQMSQLALMLTRHRQLNGQSVAAKWLDRAGPALGSTVTEVMQTAPNELAFKRTAPGGLTAIELLLFANWLEAPQFPALDLRLPPPRVRPGMRPVNLPAMPPGAPASHP